MAIFPLSCLLLFGALACGARSSLDLPSGLQGAANIGGRASGSISGGSKAFGGSLASQVGGSVAQVGGTIGTGGASALTSTGGSSPTNSGGTIGTGGASVLTNTGGSFPTSDGGAIGTGGTHASTSTGGSSTFCVPGNERECFTGPSENKDIGDCRGGTERCLSDGTGYGLCENQVLPGTEICSTGHDENCDGLVDEGADGVPCKKEVGYHRDMSSIGDAAPLVLAAARDKSLWIGGRCSRSLDWGELSINCGQWYWAFLGHLSADGQPLSLWTYSAFHSQIYGLDELDDGSVAVTGTAGETFLMGGLRLTGPAATRYPFVARLDALTGQAIFLNHLEYAGITLDPSASLVPQVAQWGTANSLVAAYQAVGTIGIVVAADDGTLTEPIDVTSDGLITEPKVLKGDPAWLAFASDATVSIAGHLLHVSDATRDIVLTSLGSNSSSQQTSWRFSWPGDQHTVALLRSQSNLVIVGYSEQTGVQVGFLAFMSPDAGYLHKVLLPGRVPSAANVDADASIVVTGAGFVARFSPEGAPIAARVFQGYAPTGIVAQDNGNVILAGRRSGVTDFADGPLTVSGGYLVQLPL